MSLLSIPQLLDRTRVYTLKEMHEAMNWATAEDGNVGLHLHAICRTTSPLCFRRAIERGEHIAHVFCQSYACLQRIGYFLGVSKIVIEYPGSVRQHLDLCGRPLKNYLSSVNCRDKFLVDKIESRLIF